MKITLVFLISGIKSVQRKPVIFIGDKNDRLLVTALNDMLGMSGKIKTETACHNTALEQD
ncbi:MAG: hypothetical protein ACU83N_17210 [Gammaproteobacteria bacterium]